MSLKTNIYLNMLVFTGVTLLGISCHNSAPAVEESTVVKTPVTVVSVISKPVASTIDVPAMSTFQNKSIVRATTAGTIDRIYISPGERVNNDQLLFTIKTREAMAAGNAAPGDTSLSFRGLINIKSKKEGIINSISYQKGDYVQEGDEMAVVEEQNSLVFILDIPFEIDRYIEKNRNCRIILPDGKQIYGNITRRLAEMDVQAQTIRYVVKPVTPEKIPANLIASVILVKSVNEKAQVLPKEAVLGDETQTNFWVMKLLNDSTAIKVPVTRGVEDNDEVEITEPLFAPGDKVLLTGNYGLADTARITISK